MSFKIDVYKNLFNDKNFHIYSIAMQICEKCILL